MGTGESAGGQGGAACADSPWPSAHQPMASASAAPVTETPIANSKWDRASACARPRASSDRDQQNWLWAPEGTTTDFNRGYRGLTGVPISNQVRAGLRRASFTTLGVAVSVGALALAFLRPTRGPHGLQFVARFDFGTWLADLPGHLSWWIPFLLLSASLPLLRAVMWGFTTPLPPPPLSVRYHAYAIGALVHNTMPARLGLLVTAIYAGRNVRRPAVEMLASLLVAKLLELAALVLAIVAVLPMLGGGGAGGVGFGRTAVAGVALVCALGLLLVFLSRAAPRLAAWLHRRGKAPRVQGFLSALTTGVRGVGSLRRLAQGLLAALAPVTANGLAYGLALWSVGAESGIWGGWLLLGALTLGQFTPGLPVGTGVYLLVCSWAARALGADDGSAAALAVLTHVATFIANMSVGAVSALIHRRDIRGLFTLRRRNVPEPPPAPAG